MEIPSSFSYSNQCRINVFVVTETIEVFLQIHRQVFEDQIETSIGENNITQSKKRLSCVYFTVDGELTGQCSGVEVPSKLRFPGWLWLVLHHLHLLIESSSGHRSVTLADDRLYKQCRKCLGRSAVSVERSDETPSVPSPTLLSRSKSSILNGDSVFSNPSTIREDQLDRIRQILRRRERQTNER